MGNRDEAWNSHGVEAGVLVRLAPWWKLMMIVSGTPRGTGQSMLFPARPDVSLPREAPKSWGSAMYLGIERKGRILAHVKGRS
jgi:hypothetical protein